MSEGSSTNDSATATAATADSKLVSLETLRRANVAGKIPIKLTLAKTSLSSATPPQPQHALISRQTFLHLGLESAVRKLHEYALPTLSFLGNQTTVVRVVQQDDDDDDDENDNDNAKPESKATQAPAITDKSKSNEGNDGESRSDNDKNEEEGSLASKEAPPYPICWFEDVATGQPLRWQYFVGVLFDSLHQPSKSKLLPWQIRLHFRSYPSQQLLELGDPNWGQNGGVLETLKMVFRNSLKQGFTIRYGNSKEALNLSKQSHDQIWEGIAQGDYDQIAPIVYRDDELETPSPPPTTATTAAAAATDVPKGNEADPSTQESKKDAAESDATKDTTKSPESASEASQSPLDVPGGNSSKQSQPPHLETINNLVMLPVRLSVDPTKPMIQKRFEGGTKASAATLGSLLLEWAPAHFERIVVDETAESSPTSTSNTSSSHRGEVRPRSQGISWRIAGLSPPLSTPLLDLWLALRHPDNFLYVTLAAE